MAMYLISSHKKGISSHQLARDIDVTQKSGWYILHKVRTLFSQEESLKLFDDVECDEAYMGAGEIQTRLKENGGNTRSFFENKNTCFRYGST